jgi:hypothetical protein
MRAAIVKASTRHVFHWESLRIGLSSSLLRKNLLVNPAVRQKDGSHVRSINFIFRFAELRSPRHCRQAFLSDCTKEVPEAASSRYPQIFFD